MVELNKQLLEDSVFSSLLQTRNENILAVEENSISPVSQNILDIEQDLALQASISVRDGESFSLARTASPASRLINRPITGTSGNDNLVGNSLNNTFIGSRGNDTINGRKGTDTVDYRNLGQAITIEATGIVKKGNLGTDKLIDVETIIGATGRNNSINGESALGSGVSLSVNLAQEKLTVNNVPGLSQKSLTFQVINFVDVVGTDKNDVLIGNSSNNTFRGGSGNDSLNGLGGNDSLFGDAGNDVLLGGTGDDKLYGGVGVDLLEGGAGNDQFIYQKSSEVGDFILDFKFGVDKIAISRSGFGLSLGVGNLSSSNFRLGTSALDSNDFFIYNQSSGQLFFDRDGTGSFSQTVIATLTNLSTLNASSFSIIA